MSSKFANNYYVIKNYQYDKAVDVSSIICGSKDCTNVPKTASSHFLDLVGGSPFIILAAACLGCGVKSILPGADATSTSPFSQLRTDERVATEDLNPAIGRIANMKVGESIKLATALVLTYTQTFKNY